MGRVDVQEDAEVTFYIKDFNSIYEGVSVLSSITNVFNDYLKDKHGVLVVKSSKTCNDNLTNLIQHLLTKVMKGTFLRDKYKGDTLFYSEVGFFLTTARGNDFGVTIEIMNNEMIYKFWFVMGEEENTDTGKLKDGTYYKTLGWSEFKSSRLGGMK